MKDATDPEADPDRGLVLACQDALREGRTPPFEELYERHHARVYRLCRRMLGNEFDAHDACQDTFFCVMRSLPAFERRSQFTSWLHNVTRNCCRELSRRSHRGRPSGWSLSRMALEVDTCARDPGEDSPLARISRCELQAFVEQSLACLSPILRSVVVPRYFGHCSYEEIAVRLGLSLGTVKSRLFRAHEALEYELARRLDLEELLAG